MAASAKVMLQVLEEAGKKGVKADVIISGGLRLRRGGNVELEEKVAKIGRRFGMRILGPNRIGVYNVAVGLGTMFLPEERAGRPPEGPIALISQSGAVMTALLDWAASENIGRPRGEPR